MNEIKNTIRLEFHGMSSKVLRIEDSQLCLTLIILTDIPLLKRYPSVNLVDGDCKVIFDVLYREVLPQRFELVTYVRVVILLLPLLFQHLKSFLQHWQWTHNVWVRSRCKAKIFLLEILAASYNRSFICNGAWGVIPAGPGMLGRLKSR